MMNLYVKNKIRLFAIVIYRKIVQIQLFIVVRNLIFRHRYDSLQNSYVIKLQQLKEKISQGEKIKVAFFIWEISKWKGESLYRLLANDERFDPYIVVVPFAGGSIKGQDYLRNMREMYNHFTLSGHKAVFPYSEEEKKMLDRTNCSELNADIIFQMNCWHECGDFTQFSYRNNTDILQAYIPYAWMISNRYWEHFNRDFHNVMWKIFYETPIHVQMAEKYAINRGINAVATGYPQLDILFDKSYSTVDVWKQKERNKKRIIWAPHAYIKDENKCSNFLFIYEQMLDIAMRYQDRIQIAFKPHPELKKKLDYGIAGWNRKKREEYYKQWEEMPNTLLCEGDYIDLFLTSDAIIHDCGSFTAEYLCTYKPMLFLESNKDVIEGWNECGKEIAKYIYRSDRGNNIEWFINEVVIEGKDSMKEERIKFVDDFLKPQNNKSASYTIYQYLKEILEIS